MKHLRPWKAASVGVLLAFALSTAGTANPDHESYFVQIEAKTKEERSKIANLGVSLEAFRSDSVWGFADPESLEALKKSDLKILGIHDASLARGGHHRTFDFPKRDARYHNYEETESMLRMLNSSHADITRVKSLGRSVEDREIWAIQINTDEDSLEEGFSSKPGIVFFGAHHAREHLSTEIPLMLAEYLLNHREDKDIARLIETRDIWVVPMVNPDGVEYDIKDGRYKSWRKNRRHNAGSSYGVDLNRNYGFKWGTGGSSKNSRSDLYMGPKPFSEPETIAVKEFIESHPNIKILLSYHTFSELILYPWGHKYEDIGSARDHAVFDKMAKTMAKWNRYKPQQASDLYIASGDTGDWAYGVHKIFAFTFELSPKSIWSGGFYPGAGIIDPTFRANLKPALYLMDLADDPYRVLEDRPTGFLENYVQPALSPELFWDPFRSP